MNDCSIHRPETSRIIALLTISLALTGCLFDEDFRVTEAATTANVAGASNSPGGASDGQSAVGGSSGGATTASAGRTTAGTTTTLGTEWSSMSAPPLDFVAREYAAYTTFEGKLFIFGGVDEFGAELDTGAIYDPKTNTWELVLVDDNTPSPRQRAAAVHVDGKLVVWGGIGYESAAHSCKALVSGAMYDPGSKRWTRMPDGWTGRAAPTIVTDGTRVVFWGGSDAKFGRLTSGEIYNVATRAWEWMNSLDALSAVYGEAVTSAESSIFVYGGAVDSGTWTDCAYRFDLSRNQWTALGRGPSARANSFGIWDGSHLYVWGGHDAQGSRNDGRLYARSWINMDTAAPPAGRWADQGKSGWASALGTDDVVFFGGYDSRGELHKDGVRYVRATSEWMKTDPWPSGEDHLGAVAVWVNDEFVLFGGRSGNGPTATGERWKPVK
jgi:N-acetylneuraminic acid mutarotase